MNLIRASGFVAKSVSEVEWDTEDNGRQLVRGKVALRLMIYQKELGPLNICVCAVQQVVIGRV